MSKTTKSILISVLCINEGWWVDQLAQVTPIIEMKDAGGNELVPFKMKNADSLSLC